MTFFAPTAPAPATTPTTADLQAAATLHNALATARRTATRAHSATAWAHEFRKLRTAMGAGRVAQVLAWYVTNVRGEYTPRVYSAKTFREKFLAIEEAMQRDHAGGPALPQSPPGDIARRLQRQLGGLHWPTPADAAAELQLIQDCYDMWQDFHNRLYEAYTRAAGTDRWFLAHVREMVAKPEAMAAGWVAEVWRVAWLKERARTWVPGRLPRYCIRLDHWRVRAMLEDIIRVYGGDRTYDQLLELINARRAP